MRNNTNFPEVILPDNKLLRILPVSHDIVRIRLSADGEFAESIMERYGIIQEPLCPPAFTTHEYDDSICLKTNRISLIISRTNGKLTLRDNLGQTLVDCISPRHTDADGQKDAEYQKIIAEMNEYHRNKDAEADSLIGDLPKFSHNTKDDEHCAQQNLSGFGCSFDIQNEDRFYGLGAASAFHLERRGRAYRNWAAYFISAESVMDDEQIPVERTEGPIPFLMCSRGWGIFVNTCWLHYFDVGRFDSEKLFFMGERGELDFYLMVGDNMLELLRLNSEITGKPYMMPQFAYGLTYMSNCRQTQNDILNDALRFREREIPCDIIEIEPQWMAADYDFSHEKDWDSSERFYMPSWLVRQEGMIGALDRMGYKLMLWLCCDDDLTFEEERQAAIRQGKGFSEEQPESWFTHLKRFVDKGVRAFKIDPARLINPHFDKKYYNGRCDCEMHNLTQTLILKQMRLGYEAHTGKRSMSHYCGAYAGIQKWGASTMGDRGGESKSLAWMLNYALSGHSNTACDMKPALIYDIGIEGAGIHLGFLSPWSELCNWAYAFQPWFLGKRLSQMFADYARLRYRLLPYFYSYAHVANRSGIPMLRPMPLAYSEDLRLADTVKQYMLGDFLLVSAFTDQLILPEGKWMDYWSGREYTGPQDIKYHIPDDRGGGLFLKQGAIIPLWPDMQYTGEKSVETVQLLIYPHIRSSFVLYEDDGDSLEYQNGAVAETTIVCEKNDSVICVTISSRCGQYEGMPRRRSYLLSILCEWPGKVCINGAAMPKVFDGQHRKQTARLLTDRYEIADEYIGADGWDYDERSHCIRLRVDESHEQKCITVCIYD